MKTCKAEQVPDPERPQELSFDFLETKDSITVARKCKSLSEVSLMILWLTGWLGGCIFLSIQGYLQPHPVVILLAAIFWMFWLIVAASLVWLLIGREVVRIDINGVQFERDALIPLSRRKLTFNETVLFREHQSEDADGDLHFQIELATTGKPLRFLSDIESDEREWLIHRLNQFSGLKNEVSGNFD